MLISKEKRDTCNKSHQIETCYNFPCHNEVCPKRHPPICKFYLRFRMCKFDRKCSYLHQTSCLEKKFELLANEFDVLKSQNEVLHSEVLKLQKEVSMMKQNSREISSAAVDTSSMKLKELEAVQHSQIPVNCIRRANGCQKVILSYYSEYTAICDSCKKFLKQKLMSSPHPHYLCPCCHKRSEGPPLSLCTECVQDILEDGYTESGYRIWIEGLAKLFAFLLIITWFDLPNSFLSTNTLSLRF